jgi:MFS family permease
MSNLATIKKLVVHNANFRRLWLAHLISLGGDWFNQVALLGLVLELTDSALNSGLILAAGILPQFLFATVSGPMADRFNRKSLMIASDVARVLLAVGMLLVRSPETVWIGILCMAGISTFSAFFQPASGASLPNLVKPEDLAIANTLMSASWGTMLAVGAALGGLVASSLGRETAFLLNAASFALSALLILRMNARFSIAQHDSTGPHPLRDIREGLVYARSDRRLVALLATKGGFGLGVGVIALLPVLATDVFRATDAGIGILFAARGLGALLGPFGAAAYVGRSERRLFLALGSAMALYGGVYLLVAGMPNLWWAAVFAVIAHLGGGAQWVLSSYGLQRLTPDYIRGRILALDLGLVALTISVSSLVAGRLSDMLDPRAVMTGLAAVELIYAVIWLAATRGLWRPSQDAAPALAKDTA